MEATSLTAARVVRGRGSVRHTKTSFQGFALCTPLPFPPTYTHRELFPWLLLLFLLLLLLPWLLRRQLLLRLCHVATSSDRLLPAAPGS